MSVPGLRSGSGHNPHTRMPAAGVPSEAPSAGVGTEVTKTLKNVRTRGRVMGTPGKVSADVYAQVIKAKQRAKRPPGLSPKQG